MLNITTENFEKEVIGSDRPVLLDFWATWCGPCLMLSPVIEEVAKDHPEIKVGKVNVDEEPDLASAYGVMSIPSLFMIKNGEVAGSYVGLTTKDKIEKVFKL